MSFSKITFLVFESLRTTAPRRGRVRLNGYDAITAIVERLSERGMTPEQIGELLLPKEAAE
jgi:hypothetical protein